MHRTALVFALIFAFSHAVAQTPIEEKTKGMQRFEGLFATYRDAKANKVLMEIGKGQLREFLFVTAIRTGLGSNDVGLDRGSLGPSEVFKVRRIADKVVFEVPNLAFRASGNDPNEQRAVRESFAPSVLWAGPVMAENEDGTVLVDISSLILDDANDVAETLRQTNQGTASVDAARTAIDFDALKSFPKNVEFEALLTFKVSSPGAFVRGTAPIPESWSIVQHMSIIELPDDGYRKRAVDPRVGAFGISYFDYAAPLDQMIQKRYVARHRLEKQPGSNKPFEPIVYYVDSGAPEPIKSALIEGASWWNEAFKAAGFEDAFRVEVMPEGADPLDARYNVIQWVHRSTRGWSYGASITDPRTGEIIKGHVTLGSLRVRQDRLIFEGLLGTSKIGSGAADDPVQLALKRIRQLSAHEVGHTLGLAHNFAASAYERGSVMDYPAPRVRVKDGRLDVSDTYGVGIGEYDKHAVKWLYSQFAAGADEKAELEKIVLDGQRRGLLYLSDGDSRSLGASDPRASLWDDGPDATAALDEAMQVRAIALKNFGADRLPKGEPMVTIQEVLVPIFLYHRYQVEAAAKAIGGIQYQHGVNNGQAIENKVIDADQQRRALAMLMDCLDFEFLKVPDNIAKLITPRTSGVGGSRELFGSRTSPNFDPVAAGEAAADIVLAALLDSSRLERLAQQSAADGTMPGIEEVLARVTETVFGPVWSRRPSQPVEWAVRSLFLNYLMQLEADTENSLTVRGRANAELVKIRGRLVTSDPMEKLIDSEIQRFLFRPAGSSFAFVRPTATPPGSPIGWWYDCTGG
jgi:hypothetical protein